MTFSFQHRFGYFFNHSLIITKWHYFASLVAFIAFISVSVVYDAAEETTSNAAKFASNSQFYAKRDAEKLIALLPTSFSKQLNQANPSFGIERQSDGRLTANNLALGLQVSFQNRGIYFKHRDTSTLFSMSLESYGFVDHLQLIQSASPLYRDNKVFYPHDSNIVEWYANTTTGIEQLFTIMQAPPRSSDDNTVLELHLSISGNVTGALDNAILQIRDLEGAFSFHYKNLQVFDKNGKVLPASMSIEDQLLRIKINTSNAVFPITVDPLLSKEYKLPSGDSIANDYYGTTVAIDGGTAIVGAHRADIAGSADD